MVAVVFSFFFTVKGYRFKLVVEKEAKDKVQETAGPNFQLSSPSGVVWTVINSLRSGV